MRYTDKQLLDRVASLPSFNEFPNGILDIWVRSAADEFNKFDDKVYTYNCINRVTPEFVMVCTGTSHAGEYGLLNFQRYNPKGCAVLKSDEIVYNSHVHGRHKSNPNCYRQSKPFPFYRDNNKNTKAEEIGEVYKNTIIWANVHPAGKFSKLIGGWSVACLVRNNRDQWNDWIGFMNRNGNPPLTVAILKEF